MPEVIAEVDRRWRVFKPFYGECPKCGYRERFQLVGQPERRAFREELQKMIQYLQIEEHLVVASRIPAEHFAKYGPVDGALFALATQLARERDVLVVSGEEDLCKECLREEIQAVQIKAPVE